VAEIRADANRVHAELVGGGAWWDRRWADWAPEADG
jgi:hypothetical protein